jgi:hypothetical protein
VKIHPAFWLVWLISGLIKPRYGYCQQAVADTTVASKPRPFQGVIGLDYRFSGGNIRQALIRANANLIFEKKQFLINPNILFTRNIIFGNKLESDVFSFLLFKARHHSKVYPVASLVYESSLIRSIDLRYLGGAGAGWNIINTNSANLELNQLVVYEKTRYSINKNLSYEGVRTHMSVIGKYRLLQNRLSVEHQFFYSALLGGSNNQRLRTFVTMRMPVSKKFSMTTNIDYIFESLADEGRAKENYITTGGLSLKL